MKKQRIAIRKMVISAMLSAITAVLTFTPIGMIPLPPPLLSVTTVHIPVIVAALAEGPLVGLLVGLVFGLCSLIRAFTSGMTGLTAAGHLGLLLALEKAAACRARYGKAGLGRLRRPGCPHQYRSCAGYDCFAVRAGPNQPC